MTTDNVTNQLTIGESPLILMAQKEQMSVWQMPAWLIMNQSRNHKTNQRIGADCRKVALCCFVALCRVKHSLDAAMFRIFHSNRITHSKNAQNEMKHSTYMYSITSARFRFLNHSMLTWMFLNLLLNSNAKLNSTNTCYLHISSATTLASVKWVDHCNQVMIVTQELNGDQWQLATIGKIDPKV